MRLAGRARRKRREAAPEPIPNWALQLVRNQPETECVAADGSILARGRSSPMVAVWNGRWVSIRQGPLTVAVTPPQYVVVGDRLTFTMPLDFPASAGVSDD